VQVSASITGRFGSKVRLHFLRPSPDGGPPNDYKVILPRGRRASFADSLAAGEPVAAETTTFVVPPGAEPGEVIEGPDELGRLVKVNSGCPAARPRIAHRTSELLAQLPRRSCDLHVPEPAQPLCREARRVGSGIASASRDQWLAARGHRVGYVLCRQVLVPKGAHPGMLLQVLHWVAAGALALALQLRTGLRELRHAGKACLPLSHIPLAPSYIRSLAHPPSTPSTTSAYPPPSVLS
jgi:hypothetical protein